MNLAQLQRKIERLEEAASLRDDGTEIAFALVGTDMQVKSTLRPAGALAFSGPRRLVVVELPEALGFLVETPARYKISHGGRCGAKSTNFARALVGIADSRKVTVLCAREFQNSTADSVYQLLVNEIEGLGLSDRFRVSKTTITNKVTGSRFRFVGLRRNPKSLKSFEGADYCWVEEAETVSDRSWEILIPTIRKPGSEIWISFNPDQKTDPTYKRFVESPPDAVDEKGRPYCIVKRVNWTDNPWCSDISKREARDLARKDPDAYMHVWEGEPWTRSDAQVLHGKWTIDEFTPVTWLKGEEASGNWDGPYLGNDFGFAVDPTVLVKLWIRENVLYFEHEAYKVGCEISDTPELFDRVPHARDYRIYADRSRPETISYLRGKGFNITRCIDWPGSVQDGIAFLRGFDRIVIHPRCKNAIVEARLYSHKVDRLTGDVTKEIVDAHNHCWDAARYALGPVIRRNSTAVKQRNMWGNGHGQRARA